MKHKCIFDEYDLCFECNAPRPKMTPQEFETATGTKPKEAAALLGLVYPRYMELRRGARKLKPYHIASMLAHMALSKRALQQRKKESYLDDFPALYWEN